VPADNAWDARSLPARSTKFCMGINGSYTFPYINRKKHSTIYLRHVLTALATSVVDLSFPRNSWAELSTVWNNKHWCQEKAYYYETDECKQVKGKPIWVSDEIWSSFHSKRSPLSFFGLLKAYNAQIISQISNSYE
jgi:hypothetical protein